MDVPMHHCLPCNLRSIVCVFLSNNARINLGFSLSDCLVHFFLISYQSAVTDLRVLPQCESSCVGGFPCPNSGDG